MSYPVRLALIVLALVFVLALIVVFIALEQFLLAGTAFALFVIGSVLFWMNETSPQLVTVPQDKQ